METVVIGGVGNGPTRFTQRANARQSMPSPWRFNKLLRNDGGENIYRQPIFRVVWGSDRLELLYSMRTRSYQEKVKYFRQPNRWVVEMWQQCLMSRDEWDKSATEWLDGRAVNMLGPYPHQGDYEILFPIETQHGADCDVPILVKGGDGECICGGGKYLGLTEFICGQVVNIVKATRAVSVGDRRNALLERESKKEDDWDKAATDAINDAGRPFGGSYFVPVSGPTPDHWPRNPELRFRTGV